MDNNYANGMIFNPADKAIPKAYGFKERLLGLSGSRSFKQKAIYFDRCSSIHTFTMFRNLRVTYIDCDMKIIKSEVVKPRRIRFSPKGTFAVIEEVL